MAEYKANSIDSRNFNLTLDNSIIGILRYDKWYSFKADIILVDDTSYQVVPKGFWDSTIEVMMNGKTLLDFKMGWKGILLKTNFNDIEKHYLLKLKGLLSQSFILLDADENELLAVDTDFTWKTFKYDFTLKTSMEFDAFENKDLMLFTTLHCVNYYLTTLTAIV